MPPVASIRQYSTEQHSHAHDAYAQVVLGLGGILDVEVAEHQARVHALQCLVIPAATRHAFAAEQHSVCLVLDIPGTDSALSRLLDTHSSPVAHWLEGAHSQVLNHQQAMLVQMLSQHTQHNNTVLVNHALALLLHALVPVGTHSTQAVLPMTQINDFIDRHASALLTVYDLARLCRLSPSHFHARFLAQTGNTPMEYVRHRRLHSARQLLRYSTLSIVDIAARVGYSSQSAFTSACVRAFGVTPRALRQASGARDQSLTKDN